MKKYVNPELEVIRFEVSDIITASECTQGACTNDTEGQSFTGN